MSDALDKLLDEVREDLGTQEARSVDWSAVDEKLFARIDARVQDERRAERARFAPQRRRGWTLAAVGVLAAAAIVALVVGKTGEPVAMDDAAASESAGTVVAVQGDAVLVDGKPAGIGATLRLGDVIETRGGEVTVERPGKLTLTLEPGTRTAVTHVKGALVLALDRGAVEAQVVPVSAGEAFAVDVAGSRVAVHGTHLRVARATEHDPRVVVDLNEGVVAVGEAPRQGSVVGTLVNAPAHVEYDAADPARSLQQTHDPSAVRPPARTETTAATPPVAFRPEPPLTHPAVPAVEPRPEPHPSSSPVKAPSPATAANAESAVAAAVRTCMANRPSADNVTVVVSTTLHLDLYDDGSVRAARFDPPVAPDVNACAAQAIYRERFGHAGTAAIRVDFSN